jgi:hypothetical protein
MSLIWVLLSVIAGLAGVILVILLFTITRSLGRRLALLVYRLAAPLCGLVGIFLVLVFQELANISRARHRLHEAPDKARDSDVQFHLLGGLFHAQRNLYLGIVGFIVSAGLLLVAWQVQSWERRNGELKQELSRLHSN